VQPADDDATVAAIAALAKTVDAVVVGVHWGQEYEADADAEQIALAKRFVEAGALVVLGSHPHVLQRIELLPAPDGRTALVAYSLGNFISNQSREYMAGPVPVTAGDTRDGALLELTLKKRKYAGGAVLTEVAQSQVIPLWTDNNTLARKRAKAPIDIHVVDLLKELKADKAELTPLATAGATLTAEQQQRAIALQRRIELLSLRLSRISDRLGGDFVPKE
jgi:poly-gamma-glutamate synthesis protein (capsule biosynthesis protein)